MLEAAQSTWPLGKRYGRALEIVRQIVDLQRELFDLGLIETAQKLGGVTQEIGWEIARKMERGNMISRSERAYRNYHKQQRAKAL